MIKLNTSGAIFDKAAHAYTYNGEKLKGITGRINEHLDTIFTDIDSLPEYVQERIEEARIYLCAGGHILLVVEAGAVAGSVLHEQFMAVGHEFLHSRGGSADAVFIVFDLFGNSDFHKVLRF